MAGKKMAAQETGGVSEESKLLGALSYIISVIIPLFVIFTEKKKDKFLLFHAYQSLFLTAVMVVVWMGYVFVTIPLAMISHEIGGLLGCLSFPLFLVFVAVALITAYKAYLGERFMLPVLGGMATKYVK